MAELPDRAAWLTAVALGMDAMPGAEAEVLEELAAHLDDRVADALARGVDPAEAERRARNRLGDPATLGRAIRKARRAKRSALALVGGGAFSFAYFSVTGIVLAVAFLGVISGLTVTIGSWALSTEWWRVPGSWVGLGASLIGLPWAARVASASVASWLPWPFGTVRVAMAVLVLLMSMAVVALLPGQELDPVLALLFPVVPLVAAVSALLAPRSTSLRPGWPMVIVAVMVVLIPSFLWSMTPPPAPPWETGVTNAEVLGRTRDATFAVVTLPSWSSGSDDHGGAITLRKRQYDDLAGWTDLAVEVWVLEPTPGGGWRYADAPLVVAPADFHGPVAWFSYANPSLRTQTWLVEVTVGIAPDGVRSQLVDPRPEQTPSWQGSVLDWWLGR